LKVRSIDGSGDWCFGKGSQCYKNGFESLKQSIKTRILSWKTDCFFARQEGVDYNNFLDRGTKDLLDRDIRRVILQTPGVIRITSFVSELDRGTRGVEIEVEIDTIFGRYVSSMTV
jgi:hypothetical protein